MCLTLAEGLMLSQMLLWLKCMENQTVLLDLKDRSGCGDRGSGDDLIIKKEEKRKWKKLIYFIVETVGTRK